MANLHVYRGGESQPYMAREGRPSAELYPGYPNNAQGHPVGGITLKFGLGPDTKRSNVWVWISPEEYENLAQAMIDAAPAAARRAFLGAMLGHETKAPKEA